MLKSFSHAFWVPPPYLFEFAGCLARNKGVKPSKAFYKYIIFMISPKWLLFILIFVFPLCVDKPFILVTDILFYDIFWVCIAFSRSPQCRTAQVVPSLSHCATRPASWVPAQLRIYSGRVWSQGLAVLRRLSQRYSRVRCWSLNLPLKHNWSCFYFLYPSFILPWMLRWFSLIIFFPPVRSLCCSSCLQHPYGYAVPSVSAGSLQTFIHSPVLHPTMWVCCW